MNFDFPFLFFGTIIFISCQNDSTTITFDVLDHNIKNVISCEPENSSEILAGKIYHDLHYIPLETNFQSLVDERHVVKIIDNHIGVLNINYSNFVLFDWKGNYILSIGSKGKHPGNLSSTYDFTILDNKIYFPSHSNKTFVIYDMDGEYVKSVFVDNAYKKLLRTKDFIIASSKNLPERYNSSNENIAFYDKNLLKILNFGFVPKYLEFIDLYDIIYKSYNNNEIIYDQILSDTIFRINSERIMSYYQINNTPIFEIDKQDYDITFNMQNGLFDEYMNNPKATYPTRNILDTNKYLILFYMFDYKHFITIYSKTEGISKTFHFDSDDIRNHVFHPSMDFTSMDNRMLIETNIQNLRSIARLLPENYLSTSNLDSILNNTDLDENSNPMIVTYRLNEEYADHLFSNNN